jgi:hypothetical protein
MAISLDLITGAISFLFTLLILSYVIGDNPLFRIGTYIFVGVSAGYIAAVAVWQVIVPRFIYPLMAAIASGSLPEMGKMAVPALGVFLLILMIVFPRLTGGGKIVMSFLVGVGAAVTIAGALTGTFLPQVFGTINAFDMAPVRGKDASYFVEAIVNAVVILAGTVFALSYFHFGARPKADGSMRRLGVIEIFAWVGRIFISITLGAIFAGVYAAALTALIERLASIINFIGNFL